MIPRARLTSRASRAANACFARAGAAAGARGARQDRPTLRQRIDLALGVAGGSNRLSVVEEGPQIPAAVPGVLLDLLSQGRGLPGAELRARPVRPSPGHGRAGRET